MRTIFLLPLLLLSGLASAQQDPKVPAQGNGQSPAQPVYTPPETPKKNILPTPDPVPATPVPQYTAPTGINPNSSNKVDAVAAKARSEFDAEKQSQEKGSAQRASTAQPADFDQVAEPKDPDRPVPPAPQRN